MYLEQLADDKPLLLQFGLSVKPDVGVEEGGEPGAEAAESGDTKDVIILLV